MPPRIRNASRSVFIDDGFTLIELLVVIAIIVILAAMLLPSLSKSKAQAQSIVCKNHLHEMALALRMYVDDYKAYPYYDIAGNFVDAPTANVLHWYDTLQPYNRLRWTNPAYHCPAYGGLVTADPVNTLNWGSYSYNIDGAADPPEGSPTFGLGWEGGNFSPPARADSQVVVPSGTFAFMDTLPEYGYSGMVANIGNTGEWGGGSYYWMGTSWSGQDWTGCFIDLMYSGSNPFATNGLLQHGKVFNVASCDAHVDSIRATDLFNPKVSAQNWNYDHLAHEDLWPAP